MEKTEVQTNRRINLQRLAEAAGTNAQLARRLERAEALINNYLNKKNPKPMGEDFARYVEEKFGLAYGVMDQPHEEPWATGALVPTKAVARVAEQVTEQYENDGRFIPIPKYSAKGGLGRGRINDGHVDIVGRVQLLRSELIAKGWRPEALGVIECEGPSMETTILDGDDALFNRDETRIVNGKIYVIEDADEGTRIKRLYKMGDGRVRVVSDNRDKQMYPDDHFTPDDAAARIIGRVVKRIGDL